MDVVKYMKHESLIPLCSTDAPHIQIKHQQELARGQASLKMSTQIESFPLFWRPSGVSLDRSAPPAKRMKQAGFRYQQNSDTVSPLTAVLQDGGKHELGHQQAQI